MTFTIYSKESCERCTEVIQFCENQNINHTTIKVKQIADIATRHTHASLDTLECIKYFPIMYDPQADCFYAMDEFKTRFGEPLLTENANRHVMFPIKNMGMWNMYEKALASFWTTNEIDFSSDMDDFTNKLNDNERHFVKHILAFFASADGIVNENLATNFSTEVQVSEARAFYSYQQFNETVHSHTYSLMIDTYVKDEAEKVRLFDGIHTIPSIAKKANWATKWINKEQCPCFAKRLVAFACVEGIMFSGSFCAIYWLKKRGLMHGLGFSNELISRDEGTHQDFAVLLYKGLRNPLREDEVFDIIREAVEHEKEFITESIPCRLIGMNCDLMKEYIEFVSDRLMLQLGYHKMYGTKNPFDFMETISLTGKTNFFERRVGEYAKAGVMSASAGSESFALDGDF
jgi:ribonucleoside-diphosphate reductase beta chain